MRLFFVLFLAALGSSAALSAQEPLRFTLADAIARAQAEGHAAGAARASRDAARERERAFGASLLPQVALTGNAPSYNRSIVPILDPATGQTIYREQEQNEASVNMGITQRIPLVGGDFFVQSALSRLDRGGTIGDRVWNSTPMLFGVRQDLLRPNRLRWDSRVQDITADIAERNYREALEEIGIQVANAFFDHYTAKVALENAANNAAVNDTLYTLNKGRFEVGRIGENDLLQSELALLRSQVALDGARLEHDRSLATLRLALNVPLGAPLEVIVAPEIPEVSADTALAVAQALRNRAAIANQHLQDTQADRQVSEARFGTGIGATLQASMGYNQTSFSGAGDAYRDLGESQRVSLAVSVPLVQWGGRSAQIQAAKLDGQRVEYQGKQVREQTAQEAHFAALELAQARRSLTIAAKADTVGTKRFEVAKNRYVIGRIGMDNLYLAQTEKDQALVQYLQSLRAYWVAYYRLRRVTMYDFAAGEAIRLDDASR